LTNEKYAKRYMNRKACWSKMANTALILCSKSQDMEKKKSHRQTRISTKGWFYHSKKL